jgi:hypothetical protein
MEETVGEPKLGSLESVVARFRILREYERGVVFTLGALHTKGPGFFL